MINTDDIVRDAEDRVKGALSQLAAERDRKPENQREGLQRIIQSLDNALWEFYRYLPRELDGGTRESGPR